VSWGPDDSIDCDQVLQWGQCPLLLACAANFCGFLRRHLAFVCFLGAGKGGRKEGEQSGRSAFDRQPPTWEIPFRTLLESLFLCSLRSVDWMLCWLQLLALIKYGGHRLCTQTFNGRRCLWRCLRPTVWRTLANIISSETNKNGPVKTRPRKKANV